MKENGEARSAKVNGKSNEDRKDATGSGSRIPSSTQQGAIQSTSSKENIVILGLRRSGKSSIVEVVFKSLPPDDSLFLESTLKCRPFDVHTFQPVRIWDGTGNAEVAGAPVPQRTGRDESSGKKDSGQDDVDDSGKYAWGTGGQLYWIDTSAVIFVIDSQDDLYDSIDRLNDIIVEAYAYNPLIHFHVFVHKVDGHSTDYRYDTLQNIQSRVADNLADASASFIFAPIAHEILADAAAIKERRESFTAELDNKMTNISAGDSGHRSGSAKEGQAISTAGFRGGMPGTSEPSGAYESNFASSAFGLPSSFGPDLERDVRLSFHTTSIYNPSIFIAVSRVLMGLMNTDVSRTLEDLCNGLSHSCKFEKVYLFDVPTKTYISTDSSPFDENNFEAISEYLNFLIQFSGLYSNLEEEKGVVSSSDQVRYSTSIVRLSPDTTLGFHQINYHMALAFIMRTDIHSKHAGMIDFNISIARKSIMDVYETSLS